MGRPLRVGELVFLGTGEAFDTNIPNTAVLCGLGATFLVDCGLTVPPHLWRTLPDPDDPESSYAGLVEARDRGMTRFVGITSHSLERARAAVESGLYDTLQYPLSHISSPEDLALIDLCRERDMGVIAMNNLFPESKIDKRPRRPKCKIIL